MARSLSDTTILASVRKVKAGLRNAAKGQYQDYPEGTIEVGVALDAIDMLAKDILRCRGDKHALVISRSNSSRR